MNAKEAIKKAISLSCFKSPEFAEPLDGGITNVNIKVIDQGREFVVRIGEDIPVHGVHRWNELSISKAAEAAKISPPVFYSEVGVLVLAYIKGKTFSEADVKQTNNLPRVIDLVRRSHIETMQNLRGPVLSFWVFHIIRDYIATLHSEGSPYTKKLPEFLDIAEKLEKTVGPIDIVLGHNDLLAANILDDGERIWLIDWEYGGFNSPLFDLGGLATNNGLSEIEEEKMLRQYFGADPSPHWRGYQAMKCASLMRETLWSMVSEMHSKLEFDYSQYTQENLARLSSAISDYNDS